MAEFTLLFGSIVLGILAGRFGWMPSATPQVLNAWVIRLALPALVLAKIPEIRLAPALIFAALGPWLVIGGAIAVFAPLGRALGWSRAKIGAVILTCGLGNTSFMGLPMVQALAGSEALGPALIADQIGSFFSLAVIGVIVAAVCSGGQISAGAVGRKIVLFPPFIALVVAAIAGASGGWPPWLLEAFNAFGNTLTPAALFSVGFQLRMGHAWDYRGTLAIGLAWKLLLAPITVLGIGLALGVDGGITDITVLQCAMAPMITGGILAADAKLEPPLAASMVGAGIALSFVSVPLWWLML